MEGTLNELLVDDAEKLPQAPDTSAMNRARTTAATTTTATFSQLPGTLLEYSGRYYTSSPAQETAFDLT